MFPPFVNFAEKVRLFEAHFVQNADIIHRRFRLVNRRDKLFFTAFGCVRLKTLTRQKQISTVLFRDVFPAIFFIRMCPASKKQRGLPGFHRKGEHEVIDPLCGRLYADTLLIFFKKQFCRTVVSFIAVEILVKAAVAVGDRIDDSCVSYYFLIKILILIRKASPEGAAGFVIYKERNHKTSLI